VYQNQYNPLGSIQESPFCGDRDFVGKKPLNGSASKTLAAKVEYRNTRFRG
jgi:hypothetical protein